MPGNSFVIMVKSPLERSTEPTEDVDQKYIATSPAENGVAASFTLRFCMLQPSNMSFIVFRATRPAALSRLKSLPVRMGSSWLHIRACTNQLPVMFQPQNSGFSTPASRNWPHMPTTSSQVLGRSAASVTPILAIRSML